VEETEAKLDWPETESVPADWRYVAAVKFVEETFVMVSEVPVEVVKFKVGKVP
jgi:hypothetical protein